MPAVSEAQRRAMEAAAHGHSTLGIPKSVGQEFVGEDAEPPKGLAAGIVYTDPTGHVLLMKRGSGEENYPGHWALPGGKGEPGEDAETAAEREAAEETGNEAPIGKRKLLKKVRTPGGFDFHTFAQPVDKRFWPKINDEHEGAGWFKIDDLPRPMHPAVAETLGEHIGAAEDMEPEEWDSLRKNFAKWTREEEKEPEHAADSALAFDRSPDDLVIVLKGNFRHGLAYDKESVRAYSKDGHLHVDEANISKACVNPYLGNEIPKWKELGLQPDRIYKLLRHPEELKKAASTFDGKPILSKHTGVTSESHRKDLTIGSVGTGVRFEHPHLKAPLAFWPQDDIDHIESGKKKELSSSYHYTADMTPGTFEGEPYDGVMRDIHGNHVAVVESGRAGSDVVVGDSTNPLAEGKFDMTKKALLSHRASVARGALMVHLQPILAQDAKIDLSAALKGVTAKNFKDKKSAIIASIEKATKGKLLAQDASLKEGLEGLLAMIEGMPAEQAQDADKNDEDEPDDKDPPFKKKAEDDDMDDDDDDMSEDDEMTDEEKAEVKKAEEEAAALAAKKSAKDKKAKDKAAKDKEMVTPKAMDEAIQAAVQKERDIFDAVQHVMPRVGKLAMAFDSADKVYLKALQLAGKDTKPFVKADAATLRGIFDMLPAPSTRQQLAQDSAPARGGSNLSIATERPGLAQNLKRIGAA